MTLPEIKSMLDETGYPVAYRHFQEENAPDMPFICYAETGTDNVAADGGVFLVVNELEVQLFTRLKDTVAENKLVSVLDEHGLFWNKEEEYEEDELCYRVTYSVITI